MHDQVMELMAFAVISVIILGVGLISQKLSQSSVTPPMIFVVIGVLVGPSGLGLLMPNIYSEIAKLTFEITLILVLFNGGTCISVKGLIQNNQVVIRLLTLGMLFSVILGSIIAGFLFPSLGFWGGALLAAILTPTDAELTTVGLKSPKIPKELRDDILAESGMNDGLILPVIIFLIVCESLYAGRHYLVFWTIFLTKQIGLGVLVGIGIGLFGSWFLKFCMEKEHINKIFEQLAGIALAFLSYSVAELVEANGFIATFLTGITLGSRIPKKIHSILFFSEAQSELFSLLTFLLFGAVLLPITFDISWQVIVFALLTLTVVRIGSVLISLIGINLDLKKKAYIGWMGPKGIASLLFGLLVLNNLAVPNREEIFQIVTVVVLMSIFLHGLSAKAATRWLIN